MCVQVPEMVASYVVASVFQAQYFTSRLVLMLLHHILQNTGSSHVFREDLDHRKAYANLVGIEIGGLFGGRGEVRHAKLRSIHLMADKACWINTSPYID